MPYIDCLKRLEATMPTYIKSIGEFQYKNEACTITRFYIAYPMSNCQACKHHLIREVYVVTNSKGENFNIGNVCIDRITSKKIGKWYRAYRRKRDNLEKNKHIIEKLDCYNYQEANHIQERLCKGFNLTKKQGEYVKRLIGV